MISVKQISVVQIVMWNKLFPMAREPDLARLAGRADQVKLFAAEDGRGGDLQCVALL
jgi:hypothetical protein